VVFEVISRDGIKKLSHFICSEGPSLEIKEALS